jgi:hypothetical protein
MKEIKITGGNLPKGKVNLSKLIEELGTDRISSALGGGTTKRQWVEIVDGVSTHRSEEVIEEPCITIMVEKDVNPSTIIEIVKAHNPEKSGAEEDTENEAKKWENELLKSKTIKSLIARIEALEKPKR